MPQINSFKLEVVTLAVSDVARAKAFYTDGVGFTLDVDWSPHPGFRVIQLTPPGSGCSVQFGIGLTDAKPGSGRATYLVVDDLKAARDALLSRGVKVEPIRHKAPLENWQGEWAPGVEPTRADYASIADFVDPDGNGWILQERSPLVG
jgi:catechol 2,3-dioxygenase-like lactoylglutathione lyase family enzyme